MYLSTSVASRHSCMIPYLINEDTFEDNKESRVFHSRKHIHQELHCSCSVYCVCGLYTLYISACVSVNSFSMSEAGGSLYLLTSSSLYH